MKISSPSFAKLKMIPARHTCDGENINPAFIFSEVPVSAKSLAIIVDDPDAPAGIWVHWLVFDIVPDLDGIKEGLVPANAVEGTTSYGQPGYRGPCPPSVTHRYYFKLFALDVSVDLGPGAKVPELEQAMAGHIVDRAELVGLYGRR